MKPLTQFFRWAPFVLTSVATLVVQATLWASPSYQIILGALAVASIIFGIKALWETGREIWAVLLVLAGLLIGQWWLVEAAAAQLVWAWRGFAP